MRRPALISSSRSVFGYSTLHPQQCSPDTSCTWQTCSRAEGSSPPENAAREWWVGALLTERRQKLPRWVAEWKVLIAVRLVEDCSLLQELLNNF